MNVVKDVKFSGRILDQVKDATAFVKTQIREYAKLGEGAVFQTTPEFPEFCWTELIVNAIAHRDYSIGGTDIQIKMFDDHLTVESPGILPGLVRVNNIREFHFSRNPKIVELLNEYDLVKEFGEGVKKGAKKGAKSKEIEQRIEAVYKEICKNPSVKNIELESLVGATKHQIEIAVKSLQNTGRIHREGNNRKGRWIID